VHPDASIDPYAWAKLNELLEFLFCDARPARVKMAECHAAFFVISPDDFRRPEHQAAWRRVQDGLAGRIKNFGSERIPDDRLTVRNATIEPILRTLWALFAELHRGSE